MKRKIFFLTLVGVMMWVGMVAGVQSSRAQETVQVTLAPIEVGVAETAQLEAQIVCPANNCGGLNVTLSFDRDFVRVLSVSPGPYLGENVFLGENTVDNANGQVQLIAAAMSPPPRTSDVLFTVEIEGLIAGSAEFRIDALTITDLSGNPVESSGQGTTVTIAETGKIPFFSPPNAAWEVAFTSERDDNPEIYVVQANGSNPRRLTDDPAADYHPAWSPSGEWIAFVSERDGNPEIYTMDAYGGNLRRLTDNPAVDTYPAWSPNGQQIAFVSDRDGNSEIYVMNADGSDPQRLTDNAAVDTAPAWSPDGQTLAFISDRDGAQALYFMDADGANVRQMVALPDAPAWYPAWSPNGAWLSLTGGQDGAAMIYRLNDNGGDLTPMTDANLPLTTSDWSPDSAWLAFAGRGEGGPDDLFVTDANGHYRFRLTQHEAADYDPDWRPVQMTCLVVAGDEDVYIYVGPGRYRGVFGLLPPHQNFLVEGQARDRDGKLWWKLDKSQIPGSEMALSLWVAEEDVDESGDCSNAPQADVPPVIVRVTPQATPTGGWGECGSCQTCGHPANECVIAPNGACVWDPANCLHPECYTISTSAVGQGIVVVQTSPNCENNTYQPGTAVSVLGIPTSVTHQGVLDHWEGTCTGATGNANPVTVIMNSNCTVIGYFN